MNTDILKHRRTKRTTVTLESDVADFIQKTMSRNRGLKEKQRINKLIRSGIKNELEQPAVNFKIEGFKSTLLSDFSTDDLERMLDEI